MGTQPLCLKWKNHPNNIVASFEQLLTTEALVDMTLVCEGHVIKAHKVILSACSPFFQNLLAENPCQHPIIILNGMKYSDLKSIVDFMYHGEINICQDQLNSLLETAETLKVNGLTEVAQEKEASTDNVPTVECTGSSEVTLPNLQTETKSANQRKKKRRSSNSLPSVTGEELSPKIEPSASPEVIDVTPDFVVESNSVNSNLLPDNCPQNQCTSLSVYSSVASYDVTNSFPPVIAGESVELPPTSNLKITELRCVTSECVASSLEVQDLSMEQATSHQSMFSQSTVASSNVTNCQMQQSNTTTNMNNQIAVPSTFSSFSLMPDEQRKEIFVSNTYCSPVRSRNPLNLEDSIKNLRCPYCRKVYSQSSSLKRHMEIHMLERKMYKCYICQKRFSWKNYLHLHLKRDHGINFHRN